MNRSNRNNRWRDPFTGLVSLQRDLDDVFGSMISTPATAGSGNLPMIDVYTEDDNQFVTELHLPGFSPEDIEIRVQGNILEIGGQQQQEQEHEDRRRRNYIVRQSVSSFYRSIALPKDIDPDKLDASFEGDTLRITAPFKGQQREARKISIKGLGKTSGRSTRNRSEK